MLRPAHLRRYVSLMAARGHAPQAVLAGSRIDPDALAGADCLVSLEQCQAVVANMIRLTGDPGLGFSLGQASQISDLGIVGHAMLSSRTVRQMTRVWVEYGNSLVGSLLRLNLEESPEGDWSLRVIDAGVRGRAYTFCVEEFLVFGVRIGGLVAGEALVLREVELSYPRPPHVALYEQTFDCPVLFDRPETRISVRSPGLDQPIRGDSDAFSDVCLQHCHQVMRQIAGSSPLISRLRHLFLQQSNAVPDMATSARALGVSVRTLRRQLLAEGASYQALLDGFRRDLAMEYLNSGHMTPKEVGYLLGFQSASNFRRAFRAWTGQTVGEYLVRLRVRDADHEVRPGARRSEAKEQASATGWRPGT